MFDILDRDNDGEIDVVELKRIFAEIGTNEIPPESEIQEMIYEMDQNGTNSICYREFEKMAMEVGMLREPQGRLR